eukprot:5234400-Amphidinium_carterae.1
MAKAQGTRPQSKSPDDRLASKQRTSSPPELGVFTLSLASIDIPGAVDDIAVTCTWDRDFVAWDGVDTVALSSAFDICLPHTSLAGKGTGATVLRNSTNRLRQQMNKTSLRH